MSMFEKFQGEVQKRQAQRASGFAPRPAPEGAAQELVARLASEVGYRPQHPSTFKATLARNTAAPAEAFEKRRLDAERVEKRRAELAGQLAEQQAILDEANGFTTLETVTPALVKSAVLSFLLSKLPEKADIAEVESLSGADYRERMIGKIVAFQARLKAEQERIRAEVDGLAPADASFHSGAGHRLFLELDAVTEAMRDASACLSVAREKPGYSARQQTAARTDYRT